MSKSNLFLIGGAKGVGKTRLTLDVSTHLEIARIETGQLVFEYLALGLPIQNITEYITSQICLQHRDLVLDTHYARYADRIEIDKKFMRGLEKEDLEKIMENFHVNPCLVEVPVIELEKRRKADAKKRVTDPRYIQQELEFNRLGYELYLKETSSDPFVLVNVDYPQTRDQLLEWIKARL